MTDGSPEPPAEGERGPPRGPLGRLADALHRLSVRRILLIGLILRGLLLPFTSWTPDVYVAYRVVMDMAGGLTPYDSFTYTYPPLWAYTLFPLFSLLGLLVGSDGLATFVPAMGPAGGLTEMLVPTVTSPLFNVVVKLPQLAADLGVAFLLLRWVTEAYGPERGKSALLLWFLNPLVLWVTAAHGQFDVLPVFLTLASTYLLLRRHFFLGGVTLGLAILFKVYPVFLFLPLLFLVLGLSRTAPADRPRWTRHPLVPFLGGTALALGVLGLPLLWTPFLEVVILRRAQFAVVGGFNPLFFLSVDLWEGLPLPDLAEGLPLGLASTLLLLLPLAVSLIVGLRWLPTLQRRAGRVTTAVAMVPILLTLVALYSALLLVNPQHLLWILPFLIVGSARLPGLRIPLLILSAAGFLYFLVLQGPAAFFYPVAAFTPWLSVDTLNAQVIAYWALPGGISTRLQQVLVGISAAVGYLALLVAAYRVAKGRWALTPAPSPAAEEVPPRATSVPGLSQGAAAALAVLIVSQGVILAPGIPPPGGVSNAFFDAPGGIFTVDLWGHGLQDTTYRITLLGLTDASTMPPLRLFHDPRLPVSNTSRARIVGIYDHLLAELGGWARDLATVDTTGLLEVLRGPPAILIVPTTTLPEVLFLEEPTLLHGWLEAGGILVWTGGHLGRYMATPDGRVIDMVAEDPTRWGPQFVLGFDPVLEEGETVAGEATSWSTALGIRFPLASWGAALTELEIHNGTALGRQSGGGTPKTSVSLFPVGSGTAVLFGHAPGPVFTYSAEDVLAHDLARILVAGLLESPHRNATALLATRDLRIPAGEVARAFLPFAGGAGWPLLRVLVQSLSPHDPLLAVWDVVP